MSRSATDSSSDGGAGCSPLAGASGAASAASSATTTRSLLKRGKSSSPASSEKSKALESFRNRGGSLLRSADLMLLHRPGPAIAAAAGTPRGAADPGAAPRVPQGMAPAPRRRALPRPPGDAAARGLRRPSARGRCRPRPSPTRRGGTRRGSPGAARSRRGRAGGAGRGAASPPAQGERRRRHARHLAQRRAPGIAAGPRTAPGPNAPGRAARRTAAVDAEGRAGTAAGIARRSPPRHCACAAGLKHAGSNPAAAEPHMGQASCTQKAVKLGCDLSAHGQLLSCALCRPVLRSQVCSAQPPPFPIETPLLAPSPTIAGWWCVPHHPSSHSFKDVGRNKPWGPASSKPSSSGLKGTWVLLLQILTEPCFPAPMAARLTAGLHVLRARLYALPSAVTAVFWTDKPSWKNTARWGKAQAPKLCLDNRGSASNAFSQLPEIQSGRWVCLLTKHDPHCRAPWTPFSNTFTCQKSPRNPSQAHRVGSARSSRIPAQTFHLQQSPPCEPRRIAAHRKGKKRHFYQPHFWSVGFDK